MKRMRDCLATLSTTLLLCACGSAGPGGTGDGGANSTSCTLSANTTPTGTTNPSGCAVRSRDASSCLATRQGKGLTGFWLKFSCRVTLSSTTDNGASAVAADSDGQPDYPSFYFAPTNACYEAWSAGHHNPSSLSAQSYHLNFPLAPNTTATSMMGTGIVGMSVNGVPIFANFAAPGDDIYLEAISFDKCDGHPQNRGQYHYHSEPNAITNDDANLVGVLRDGYPLYGRKDAAGTYPTLDIYGGHTSVTADSPSTAVYHYHVNEQTSTGAQSQGQKQWFLTTGTWRGTPGSCPTCN